jgi:hypothetical protein
MKSTATAILAAILLAFGLAGCAPDASKGPTYPVVGTVDQTTMEQSAFAARSAYAAVLHLAVEYVALPRCGAPGTSMLCSSQAVVDDMRRYSAAADTATGGAVALARAPTKSPIALANAVADAQRAVQVFRNTVAAVNPKAATTK